MKHFLLACSLFLAVPAVAAVTKTASDDAHIAQFKEQLETCRQTLKKDYEAKSQELLEKNTKRLYYQHQKICAEAFQCYQKVSDQIFDIFYPQKKEDMKKYMTAFINTQINLYGSTYAQNKICYPTCGLAGDINSQIDTLQDIHIYLSNILNYMDDMYW